MSYDFSKYLNIPYKNIGRDFSGVDCYGLVYLVFKTELGIILPDYTDLAYSSDWPKHGKNHILENINNTWIKVNGGEPRILDCHGFIDEANIVSHIGISIGRGRFLHCMEDRKVEIGNLDLWSKKLRITVRYFHNA